MEICISSVNRIAKDLHQILSKDNISYMEAMFKLRQATHTRLSSEEFEKSVWEMLPPSTKVDRMQLKNIFAKMDLCETGLIDWDDFITYVITSLQRTDSAALNRGKPIHSAFQEYKGPNHDMIRRIDLMPGINPISGEVVYSNSRFVTASKDGILAVWTQKWKLQKYKDCYEGSTGILKRKVLPYILDMVCLPNAQMIATCSTDNNIRFYDASCATLDLLMTLTGMENIPTCLDFWFDIKNLDYSILTVGDTGGGLLLLEFYKSVTYKLFNLQAGFASAMIKLSDIIQNHNEYIKGTYYPNQHDQWVRKVKYIPELKSILSCAISSTSSMVILSIFHESGKRIFLAPKGISCFDYSSHHNTIVSGSIDRCLRVWNPYVNKKPVEIFTGHVAPVRQVMIIDDQFLSISLSEDRCVKVWDMKEHTCLQTLNDRTMKWGSRPVFSAMHDPIRRLLLLGSNKLIVFERVWQTEIDDDQMTFTSHAHPLTGIAYSSLYNYLISSGDNGKIVCWDLESGRKKIEISPSHVTNVDGNQVPAPITAMSLDSTSRRLFTAGGDGLLKIWLLTNGGFFKSLNIPDGKDINSILVCRNQIFFGGWSKRVYVCDDNFHLDTLKTWAVYHNDDIMEICHIQPNKIASSSWDGRIAIWMLETGQLLSIWSLHSQCFYHHLNELTLLPKPAIKEYNALDFGDFQRKCVKCHSREKCLLHFNVRNKMNAEPPQLTSDSAEVGFPAIYCMVTLSTRMDKAGIGNVFIGDTNGFIQLWSVGLRGGFIALFSNTSLKEQYTTCLTTDVKNNYLFTGDTSGFIRVWYIKYFYSGVYQPSSDELDLETTPFPFSTKRLQLVKERVLEELKILEPKNDFKFANVDYPPLISSFRGHLKPVVKIIVLEEKQVILTASKDKSVRIWTFSGAYLRTLGDKREFSLDLVLSTPISPPNRKAPADVIKVASGLTLQVIYQGMSPNWYRLRQVILRTYIKSIRRKRIEDILLKSLSDLRQEDQVKKSRVSVMERRQAQKIKFSQMGAPLGKFYAFKEKRKDNSALPSIPNTYKKSHSARLTLSKSTHEQKTNFR